VRHGSSSEQPTSAPRSILLTGVLMHLLAG
jgi:hypothetical protein